jgi:serine/threonine-protein kinase
VGFWDRFRKKPPEATPTPAADEQTPAVDERTPIGFVGAGMTAVFDGAPAQATPKAATPKGPDVDTSHLPPDVASLVRAGTPGGPEEEEAVALFRQLRQSPDEALAVEELVRATQIRGILPERLAIALASALVDRGEPEVASRVLAQATSSAALLLLADLAEQRGELPTALALVERVMLRDIDHPGARERHRRWRAQLGYEVRALVIAPGATVVTREPDAPFDLLREVGRGGAGAVYEAVDRELGRHVALKVYHQAERDRPQLAHEAQLAVALEGPAIVRVFDVDPEHGWLALEWAAHGTLREKIRARDVARILPIERWAAPLATALARVHAAGWVHHDVKPANVLLDRGGRAILTDFGIARRVSEPSPAGSLGYLSPERIKGRPSDPRDDVYAFGRVLEDALEVLPDDRKLSPFRALAASCTGPDVGRPADGRALLTRIRVEIGGTPG